MCSGRIENNHATSIKSFMKWLQFSKYKQRFLFIYSKADTLTAGEKVRNLADMCNTFRAEDYQAQAMKMKDGDVKRNLATSFPPGAEFDQVKEDHRDFVSACVSNSDMPAEKKRIPVDSSCTIL